MAKSYQYLGTKKSEKNREYFAAKKDPKDCVRLACQKIDEYFAEMNRTGRINLYRNSYFKFFQGFILKGAIYHSGTIGELTNTFVNHYNNLITHTVNLTCQQKLAYEPQATVDDSQAQDQLRLAKGLLHLEANRSDKDLDGKVRLAVEMSEVFMESYVSVFWNKDLGRTIAGEMDEEAGEQIVYREGDNEYEVWTPFDVIVDTALPANYLKKWVILRRWENKFEVAARYPNYADQIKGISVGGAIGDTQLTYSISGESDIIPVYYLLHAKTSAVPDGRLTIFIDPSMVLADGELQYREVPLYRMASHDLWGSPYGYSSSADILSLQECVDRLCSAILTNQLTFATQNILIAKGSSIDWEQVYGGLNVVEWDSSLGEVGKPAALQLTATPKEVFDFVNLNIQWMGTLKGINEAIKGNADLILKGQASGAALALMSSNAIQFNSATQKAYVRLCEQVGTAIIHNIQDFGFPTPNHQREGMSESGTGKYFKSQYGNSQLDKIDRIMVRYGNPLTQTTSGKLQIAETLMQAGKITPDQYFEVMETGNLESQLLSEQAQLKLIKEENEALMTGKGPQPLWADNHTLHIQEHLAEIANLDARRNVNVIGAFKMHIDGHVMQLKNLDPVLASLMKQPILNAPPAPPAPAGPGGPRPPQAKPSMPAPNNAGVPQRVPIPGNGVHP